MLADWLVRGWQGAGSGLQHTHSGPELGGHEAQVRVLGAQVVRAQSTVEQLLGTSCGERGWLVAHVSTAV
jgi:hypothetical protein